MVAKILGFSHTWLTYKKKEYKNDIRWNEVYTMDKKENCRWYNEMDVWNNICASIKITIVASAIEKDKDQEHEQEQDNLSTPLAIRQYKKSHQDKLNGLLEQVVTDSTTLICTFEQSTNSLKNMDKFFIVLLEKFWYSSRTSKSLLE